MTKLYTENEIVDFIEQENIELLYEAIESGLNLHQPVMGMNALFWAVKNNSFKIADFLLDNHFDINLKGIYKGDACNALGVCIYEKNLSFFHYLIDRHIQTDALYKSKTILMHAIELDDVGLVEKILHLDGTHINAKDNIYGDTALILASRNNQVNIIELLLEDNKIKIDAQNVLSRTAFQYYLSQDTHDYELIKLFILTGAAFNLNDMTHINPDRIIELNDLKHFAKTYGVEAKKIYLEKKHLEQNLVNVKESKKEKKI
jgi:ankyrin repeat protein